MENIINVEEQKTRNQDTSLNLIDETINETLRKFEDGTATIET